MKTRNTLQLAIIVVILGCGLYLLDENLDRRQNVRAQVRRVFDINTDPVTRVAFEQAGARVEIVRKGESWFLQEPVRARANSPQAERIVSALESLRIQGTITRRQREHSGMSLADYGLQDSDRRFSVETATGRAETLLLGGRTPFGDAVYARLGRGATVFTLPGSVLSLFPDDLAALRDRTLLHGNAASTERIDIHRRNAGFLQLVRRKSEWIVQQPLATKADAAAVRKLLDSLFALRVATFHWDANPERDGDTEAAPFEMTRRAQFEAAGLAEDAARLKITVWTEGDRLGQDLYIGTDVAGTNSTSFARRGGVDAVYTVPSDIIEACSRPVETFRNRSVFHSVPADIGFIRLQQGDSLLELERLPPPVTGGGNAGWQLRTPVRAPADPDAVAALVTRLLDLRITAFLGANQSAVSSTPGVPPMLITLAKAVPVETSAEPVTLDATAMSSTTLALEKAVDGVRHAVMTGREDDRFTLDAETTADLDASLISPLRFRHRLMLAIDAAAVSRIQVIAPSNTCGVVRVTATPDAWFCPDEPTLAADTGAVANLLAAAARIEAARFVAFMPPDFAAYGLDKPSATVTFGFRADDGLQNTLLLGSAADDAWRYARVQGHEFVFLLAEAQVARLLQPLCIKPPVMPAPAAPQPLSAVTDTTATNAATTHAQPATAPVDGAIAP
jgi:hypothetical protein